MPPYPIGRAVEAVAGGLDGLPVSAPQEVRTPDDRGQDVFKGVGPVPPELKPGFGESFLGGWASFSILNQSRVPLPGLKSNSSDADGQRVLDLSPSPKYL